VATLVGMLLGRSDGLEEGDAVGGWVDGELVGALVEGEFEG